MICNRYKVVGYKSKIARKFDECKIEDEVSEMIP